MAVTDTRHEPAGAAATAEPDIPTRPAPAEISHQETADWLAKHPEALARFEEGWVAMEGYEVVGAGPSIIDAFEQAKALGFDDPLMVPIWPDEVVFVV